LNRNTSLFLDFLRVVAAFGVVLVHTGSVGFSHLVSIDPAYGLGFVVIFFVLSGYVISFSVSKASVTARTYAIARLSRLYSVLIPALALTAVLVVLGRFLNPTFYASFNRGRELIRFLLSALFLQESWNLSAAPPTNIPLWSLAYEFWYYFLFGILFFSSSRRFKLGAAIAGAAIAGPKILLLLPAWAAGVASYRLSRKTRIKPLWAAILLLILSALASVLWTAAKVQYPWRIGYPPLYFSNAFVSDILLSLFVAATIYFFDRVTERAPVPVRLGRLIRRCADMTFSLYLLHYPFLIFAAAVVPFDRSNRLQTLAVLLVIVILIGAISLVTEAKRPALARWLERSLPPLPRSPGDEGLPPQSVQKP
jgi:peptidoglycan/LPS O-acetylase OafA/YrhL